MINTPISYWPPTYKNSINYVCWSISLLVFEPRCLQRCCLCICVYIAEAKEGIPAQPKGAKQKNERMFHSTYNIFFLKRRSFGAKLFVITNILVSDWNADEKSLKRKPNQRASGAHGEPGMAPRGAACRRRLLPGTVKMLIQSMQNGSVNLKSGPSPKGLFSSLRVCVCGSV